MLFLTITAGRSVVASLAASCGGVFFLGCLRWHLVQVIVLLGLFGGLEGWVGVGGGEGAEGATEYLGVIGCELEELLGGGRLLRSEQRYAAKHIYY